MHLKRIGLAGFVGQNVLVGHIVQARDCIQIPIGRGVKGSLVLMTNKHDKNDHKSGVVMSILGIFTVVAKKGDRFSLSPNNVRI